MLLPSSCPLPVIVTVACAARPETEADPGTATPTTSPTPSTGPHTTETIERVVNLMRAP